MASFQKRGKTWQYTISHVVNGKSNPIRKGGFKTKKEAQIVAAEIEDKLNKGLPVHNKLEPFNEYFEQWVILYKKGVSKGTQTLYQRTFRVIDKYFGATPIQHIKKSDYQAFLNEYGEDKSKETVKKINSHIRACILDAMDDGVTYLDFTRKAIITGKDRKDVASKHLNYGEVERLSEALWEYLEKEFRPVYLIILLALNTGMRFAELIGLTRDDFDFKNNTIFVTKSWGYLPTTEVGKKKTKTFTSMRVIEMDDRTMSLFKRYFKVSPDNIHRLVFYNPASKYRVYSNTGVNKALKKLLESLKIKRISIHGLRHTHASILIYKKVSIQYISERLGHSDTDTTYRVYAHLLKEMRAEDVEKTKNVFAHL